MSNKFRNSAGGGQVDNTPVEPPETDDTNNNNNSDDSSQQENPSGNSNNSTESRIPSLFDVITGLLGITDSKDSDGYMDSAGVIHYKDKFPPQSEPGYYNSTLVHTSPSATTSLLDKMKRVPKAQRVQALDYDDTLPNSVKKYRDSINRSNDVFIDCSHNLRIGDVEFQVPPEYISVVDSSHTVQHLALRRNSTLKTKTGHSNRSIVVTLFLNGMDQINGVKTPSPVYGNYYMNGLLGLIAQFKCTPFLPIANEYINNNFSIFTVALESLTANTVPGFPNCIELSIMLREFESAAFTEVPNNMYHNLIEWDLQRFYYQRYINKNLKPLKYQVNHNDDLNLSILDFDKVMEAKDDFDIFDNKNYKDIVNKNNYDYSVTGIDVSISNMFATQQLQMYTSPSMQYLGGGDVALNITIETKDNTFIQSLSAMLDATQHITRTTNEYGGVGLVKVDNSIINLFGVNYFMINSLSCETVPEFPGLSIVKFECLSYNISNTGILKGFRPFPKDAHGTEDNLIAKKRKGLAEKIKQDNMIERKLTTLNLYPDLDLPTYKTVDNAIKLINGFKEKHGLPKISYKVMPRQSSDIPGGGVNGTYQGYVDPDFYFKYDSEHANVSDEILKQIHDSPKIYNEKYRKRKEEEAKKYQDSDKKDKDKKEEDNSESNSKSRLVKIEYNVDNPKTTSNKYSRAKTYLAPTQNLVKEIPSDRFNLDNNRSSSLVTTTIPFMQSTNPTSTVGRMFAIGENDKEFEEAWIKGNEKYTYQVGGGAGGAGGAGGIGGGDGTGGMMNGVNHEVKNITGNALADLALSLVGRSWYFFGAFGGEIITQEFYNKMARYDDMNCTAQQRNSVGKGWLAFDCSSLVSWCLRKCGVRPESFRGTSSSFPSDFDIKVPLSELQVGDVLRKPNHIGLYIGNGKTVEAFNPTNGVGVGEIGWAPWTEAGRYNNVPSTASLLSKNNNNSSDEDKPKEDKELTEDNRGSTRSLDITNTFSMYMPRRPVDGNDRPTTSPGGGSSSGGSSSSSSSGGSTAQENSGYTSSVTADMLDRVLGGALRGMGNAYCSAGRRHGVNPALAASIAIHETGNGTSKAVVNKRNT